MPDKNCLVSRNQSSTRSGTFEEGRLLAIIQRNAPKLNAVFHIGSRATSSLSKLRSTIQSATSPSQANGLLKREGDRTLILATCEMASEVKEGSRGEAVNASPEPKQPSNSNSDVSLFEGASNINFAGPAIFNVYVYGQSTGATAAPLPLSPMVASLVFIDAIGRHHDIPISMAGSYESFIKSVSILLSGEKMEARIQRGYLQREMFDICIDQGSQVTPVMGEAEWSAIHPGPGTSLVMRVVLEEKRPRTFANTLYMCPRPGCGFWNNFTTTSINCKGCEGRFQLSLGASNRVYWPGSMTELPAYEMVLVRNFHVKRNVTPPEYAIAKYKFAEGPKEICLDIEAGEIIEVFGKSQSGWWDGYVNGVRGWFPSNYVAAEAGSLTEAKEPDQGLHLSNDDQSTKDSEEAIRGADEQPVQRENESSSYTPLVTSLLRNVSTLLSAVSADQVARFEPSVTDIVSTARAMMTATKTQEQTQDTLEAHPALGEAGKNVLSTQKSLVLQSQRASVAELKHEDRDHETEQMVYLAGQLFSSVRTFCSVADEYGVELQKYPFDPRAARSATAPDTPQILSEMVENPTL